MNVTLRMVKTGLDGRERFTDVMTIERPDSLHDIGNLGLSQAEGQDALARLQREFVSAQVMVHNACRPSCGDCDSTCHVKDCREHTVATLFGTVSLRLSRYRCVQCKAIERNVGWSAYCRSTPELDRLGAHLCALMPYQVAADLLTQLFPVSSGKDAETMRRRIFKIGAALGASPMIPVDAAAASINVTLDSTFIRSCEDDARHLEVRVGNVETSIGGRQVFAAVAKAETDIAVLIKRNLNRVGRSESTELTAFTDGCDSLRNILDDTGVSEKPALDWFHVAMRLQHLKASAVGLPIENPQQEMAKAEIIKTAERLRWRLWNGQAEKAPDSIASIEAAMSAFEGDAAGNAAVASLRKLRKALCALQRYLTSQSDWLINYAQRHNAGLRVGTSLTEGTANFLVNRRMAKSQQMRWSRRGADRLLQVRCALYNGTLGSKHGQKFFPANDTDVQINIAA